LHERQSCGIVYQDNIGLFIYPTSPSYCVTEGVCCDPPTHRLDHTRCDDEFVHGFDVLPLAFIIVGDIFTLEQRAKVQGLFSGVWGVSSVIGPLIGGFLVVRRVGDATKVPAYHSDWPTDRRVFGRPDFVALGLLDQFTAGCDCCGARVDGMA